MSSKTDALMAPLAPSNWAELNAMARTIGGSGLWPGIRTPEQAIAVVSLGAAMGFTAPQALQLFHIVEGRPSLSAAGPAAVMQASPEIEYVHPVEASTERCVLEGKRRGAPGPVRACYTIEEAIKAGRCSRNPKGVIVAPGRSGKPGAWETATEDMLYARALSRLARRLAPDLLMGIYVPDEMEQITADDAPRIEARPEPTPAPASRRNATPAETVARRVSALRGTSAPPAAVEDAEVLPPARPGREVLADALAAAGLTEAEFDHWCANNRRPVVARMDNAQLAKAARFLSDGGAGSVAAWLKADLDSRADRRPAASAAPGPLAPDAPSADELQAALEDKGVPADLADAWARHKGIKPATEAGARALWLSIMHHTTDAEAAEWGAFLAQWDATHTAPSDTDNTPNW